MHEEISNNITLNGVGRLELHYSLRVAQIRDRLIAYGTMRLKRH